MTVYMCSHCQWPRFLLIETTVTGKKIIFNDQRKWLPLRCHFGGRHRGLLSPINQNAPLVWASSSIIWIPFLLQRHTNLNPILYTPLGMFTVLLERSLNLCGALWVFAEASLGLLLQTWLTIRANHFRFLWFELVKYTKKEKRTMFVQQFNGSEILFWKEGCLTI